MGPGGGHHLQALHEHAGVELRLGRRLIGVRDDGTLHLDDGTIVEPTTSSSPSASGPPRTGRRGRRRPVDAGPHADPERLRRRRRDRQSRTGRPPSARAPHAARAMLGLPQRAEQPPLVWSDQHGVRIQRVGDPRGARTSRGDLTYVTRRPARRRRADERPGRAREARRRHRHPDQGGRMTLTVQIDDGACLAHGDCVHAAPGVFVLTGDVAEQSSAPAPTSSSAPPPAPARPARSSCSTRRPARRSIPSDDTARPDPCARRRPRPTIATRAHRRRSRAAAAWRVVCVLVVPSARVTATVYSTAPRSRRHVSVRDRSRIARTRARAPGARPCSAPPRRSRGIPALITIASIRRRVPRAGSGVNRSRPRARRVVSRTLASPRAGALDELQPLAAHQAARGPASAPRGARVARHPHRRQAVRRPYARCRPAAS